MQDINSPIGKARMRELGSRIIDNIEKTCKDAEKQGYDPHEITATLLAIGITLQAGAEMQGVRAIPHLDQNRN